MKNPQKLQLEIQDPSGEIRRIRLGTRDESLGAAYDCTIPLRDPTLPPKVATLTRKGDQIWIRMEYPKAQLAGISLVESQLPPHLPLEFGETRLRLRPVTDELPLPTIPSHIPAWKTTTESGKDVLWLTKKAASTPLSVYLTGETGTGKEVLAHLLHHWSDRAAGPFVPIHCGALPASIAESELFGHVKGAYTGAHQSRPGALMQAHNGTLFLDEIGDLSLDMQVKLLRFLENGEIRAVGADHPSRSNVRIVCATHRNLPELIAEGKFRRDLYYRIASITIQIPSLRSRPDDIDFLARAYAENLGKEISASAMDRLVGHPWPGNVRELRHAIERAAALAGPFTRLIDHGQFAFLGKSGEFSEESINLHAERETAGVLRISEMERILTLKALRVARGNRREAAKLLGVARSTLFEMLKRHGIPGPRAPLSANMH